MSLKALLQGCCSRLHLTLAALAIGASGVVCAQSSPSVYTKAMRYDAAQRVVGIIEPDPDDIGPLRYAATRYIYDSRGLITFAEIGELASWQPESVSPIHWPGFSVFRRIDFTYDATGAVLSEKLSSAGSAFLQRQYSYDSVGRLQCRVRRMNVAAFTSALQLSACQPGTQGAMGPDRIERFGSYDNSDRPLALIKAYGTSLQQTYATFTYSGAHVASIQDANGNLQTIQVDGFGRLEYWYFPSATVPGQSNGADFERYTYDLNDNRTQWKKRDGSVINYSYDGLDQVTSKDGPGPSIDVT